MKTMSVGELKTNFSEVLKRVMEEEVGILYGKKKEIVARIVPKEKKKKGKRKLGRLEGKAKVKFMPDLHILKFKGLIIPDLRQ